jgi:hypothetical protein
VTLDAGLAQLTMGRAWWFRKYAGEQSPEDRVRYESAEQEVRAKKIGLWRDRMPEPPWEWWDARRKPQGTAAAGCAQWHCLPESRLTDRRRTTRYRDPRHCREAQQGGASRLSCADDEVLVSATNGLQGVQPRTGSRSRNPLNPDLSNSRFARCFQKYRRCATGNRHKSSELGFGNLITVRYRVAMRRRTKNSSRVDVLNG